MKVKHYVPHRALKDYVLNISTIEAELPVGVNDIITPYPPTPFQSLIFYCDNPISMGKVHSKDFNLQPKSVVIGPQYSRVNIQVHRRLTAIRTDFAPGGLYRLLGISMKELYDEGFDGKDVFGNDLLKIEELICQCKGLEEGKKTLENFLLSKLSNLKELLPIDSALKMMLKFNGNLSITSAADLSCLSLKQFERKCKDRLGMNPKMFARILRFSHAYRMHESHPDYTWTKISHEAGYFDQMHLIRDFKTFAGVNPSNIEKQLLDTPLRMQRDLQY